MIGIFDRILDFNKEMQPLLYQAVILHGEDTVDATGNHHYYSFNYFFISDWLKFPGLIIFITSQHCSVWKMFAISDNLSEELSNGTGTLHQLS